MWGRSAQVAREGVDAVLVSDEPLWGRSTQWTTRCHHRSTVSDEPLWGRSDVEETQQTKIDEFQMNPCGVEASVSTVPSRTRGDNDLTGEWGKPDDNLTSSPHNQDKPIFRGTIRPMGRPLPGDRDGIHRFPRHPVTLPRGTSLGRGCGVTE